MKVDLLEMLFSAMESHRVQILMLNVSFENISQFDFGFRKNIFEHFDYTPIVSHLSACLKENTLLTLKDDLGLYYAAIPFPTGQPDGYPYKAALIGPFLFQPVTKQHFRTVIEEKQLLPSQYRDIQEFYNRIPIIPNLEIWSSILRDFSSRIMGIGTGTSMQFSYADFKHPETFAPNYEDYQLKEHSTIALSTIEERYQIEASMLNAVANGNVKEALHYRNLFMGFRLAPRISDPLRNWKNLAFVLNTLLRKAVQSASVHPLHIDNLSTQMAIQIESSTNLHQLEVLMATMIRKYCLLVQSYSRKAYSKLIQTCMDHIDFHYQEEMSLDSLAKMCSVSNSYLSTLFRKEVHMTLTDYLNKTRIRQALILLNTTNQTIQTIAQLCGFDDSNYFTRIFKKYQGQSPKQYRDSIRR